MQTAKNEVADLLKRLPDNCTLEDVQYHLYVIQKIICNTKIERGLKDEEEGRVYEENGVDLIESIKFLP